MVQVWRGARIFDGWGLREGCALAIESGRVARLMPDSGEGHDLGGGIIAPGFVDLQVNGGGGALLGQGDPDLALTTICAAHGRLGTTGLLPTLISADRETTRAVLAAGARAAKSGLPGFLGLHLEGPHLDPLRKGAHDGAVLRPMLDEDVVELVRAKANLPALMVTLAPAQASPAQMAALAAGGVIVSLGHAECTEDQANVAFAAGARSVTHLFNAMSALGHRAPGLVGAALAAPVFAGIIPDGVHVARTPFRLAVQAKPGRLFAVSDAMAVAGTDLNGFDLGGRRITRQGGRLTLDDGTLAGADISLPQALAWMVGTAAIEMETALAMVTRIPADALGRTDLGRLCPGAPANWVHLDLSLALRGVWRGGVRV